jgi:hypothetical protein
VATPLAVFPVAFIFFPVGREVYPLTVHLALVELPTGTRPSLQADPLDLAVVKLALVRRIPHRELAVPVHLATTPFPGVVEVIGNM